jgi:hypothetical protein
VVLGVEHERGALVGEPDVLGEVKDVLRLPLEERTLRTDFSARFGYAATTWSMKVDSSWGSV